MGNGFSRMLQMMNVDVKKSNDSNYRINDVTNLGEVSDDDMVRAHSNYNKKVILPKVNVNKKESLNMSADNLNGEDRGNEHDNNRPTM